jgi:hypothetical protein
MEQGYNRMNVELESGEYQYGIGVQNMNMELELGEY